VEESTLQPSSKGGTKRGKDAEGEQKSKAAKIKGDVSVGRVAAGKNADDSGEARDFENRLETQSKDLWALKDDLKKHVTTTELREMLDANRQGSTGSELDLRDRW
jgi:poly [ADP-ribose] polymerase